MSLRDILVHVDHTEPCRARVDLAAALAAEHGAHLTGLFADPGPLVAMIGDVPYSGELVAELERQREARRARAGTVFAESLRGSGANGELREVDGQPEHALLRQARYADLVVVGQPRDEAEDGVAAPGPVVVDSPCPVLVVPYIGAGTTLGRRVVVAWNDSRESARAVNDALPLLANAETVRVLAINPPPDARDAAQFECADVCLHLARHGVKAEADSTVAPDLAVGEALLSRVADFGADLVVMGAYGHSRLRELILGGASRHLLGHMTVPVLMSH